MDLLKYLRYKNFYETNYCGQWLKKESSLFQSIVYSAKNCPFKMVISTTSALWFENQFCNWWATSGSDSITTVENQWFI